MADWLTPEQRNRNMAAIRSSGTSPEKRLGVALRVAFPRRHIVRNASQLPGRPDYYLPGLRLAVFADGCFWHCCPTHGRLPSDNRDYWEPKLVRNVSRDREAVTSLRNMGIQPMRLWEHELGKRTMDATIQRVKGAAARPSI
jgi:DNA mismatch endonuclease (patch repair protein)